MVMTNANGFPTAESLFSVCGFYYSSRQITSFLLEMTAENGFHCASLGAIQSVLLLHALQFSWEFSQKTYKLNLTWIVPCFQSTDPMPLFLRKYILQVLLSFPCCFSLTTDTFIIFILPYRSSAFCSGFSWGFYRQLQFKQKVFALNSK